jgi:O-methyltransferase involved in polyketide biosynthesis
VTEGSGQPPAGIDATIPTAARMYDYWLGGRDNFAADRIAALKITEHVPGTPAAARANRRFLGRAVRYLAGEAGIRQFIDLGAGLPTNGNVHQVARQITPDAILAHSATGRLIDFSEPVAILFVSVLHFVPEPDAHAAVAAFAGAAAPGSHLVVSHGYDNKDPQVAATTTTVYASTASPVTARSREQILAFLDGLDILEPGLVPVQQWRPGEDEPPALDGPGRAWILGGVGRKP